MNFRLILLSKKRKQPVRDRVLPQLKLFSPFPKGDHEGMQRNVEKYMGWTIVIYGAPNVSGKRPAPDSAKRLRKCEDRQKFQA